MTKNELRRLIKIESRINQIAQEELGLHYYPIEFDIIPPQKMLEIMAYNIPTNISNWKYGRDYERERTIFEHSSRGLPYEVVINSNPARAYLMNDNKFAVQCLVMAHVVGHCAFFSTNKYFINSRQDIVNVLYEASRRFLKYEKQYGIDEVEKTIDAGHALQFHSSPFESRETESEKRLRIFKQLKKEAHVHSGEYKDVIGATEKEINEDIELYNQKLWRRLKLKTPVEPTEDILRYIIDNSFVLEDWQKDILETLRLEGQYFWPMMKTKQMNEGFAVRVHEKIMTRLFEEGLLSTEEHGDYNYSNSLVKAENPFQINPYLFGSSIWADIEKRWDRGMHGIEWDECTDSKLKEEWDTHENRGWEKCLEILETYIDWFFISDFLTPELISEIKLYIYKAEEALDSIDYVITKDTAKEIKEKLVNAFAQSSVPKIEVVNGNYNEQGILHLKHKYDKTPLEATHAKKTMEHVAYLWGRPVVLDTMEDDAVISWRVVSSEWEYELSEEDLEVITQDLEL